jgi:hypothetical protein
MNTLGFCNALSVLIDGDSANRIVELLRLHSTKECDYSINIILSF